MKKNILTFCMALSCAFFTVSPHASAEEKGWLGVNLDGLADYSSTETFNDAMKSSRRWGRPREPWKHEVKTDELGWPVEDAGVIVFADRAPEEIEGRYRLSFDGQAVVEPLLGCATISDQSTDAAGRNHAIITVLKGKSMLMISFTKTNGGVRNVTLVRESRIDKGTFTPELLAALQPFQVIRFMDFENTNSQNRKPEPPWFDATPLEWSQRTTPRHATQACQHGAAYEYVAELANVAKKDAWITVPIHASKDYQRQMATFFKEHLDSERVLYVELGNEVWNWSFAAAQYNLSLAKANPLFDGKYYLCHAWRTYECAQIFIDVFGKEAVNKNLRFILAWQFGWNPPDAQPREMLEFVQKQSGKPVSEWLHALSIAPYFSEPKPEDCKDVETIHAQFRLSSDQSVEGKTKLLKLVKEFNLPGGLCCYEGGPHHRGQVETNLAIRMAAHRAPQMKDCVMHDLGDNWRKLGGGIFCYFTLSGRFSKWGCWGAVESLYRLDTPKYQALKELSTMP